MLDSSNFVRLFHHQSFALYSSSIYITTIINFILHNYFHVEISLFNTKTFIEECILTSKLDHPNVLSLIGVSMNTEDGTLHMIMPFMHHGDVKSFLKSKRGNSIELDHFPEVVIYMYVLCSAKLDEVNL